MRRSSVIIIAVTVGVVFGLAGFGIGRSTAPKVAQASNAPGSGRFGGAAGGSGFGGGARRGRPVFGTVTSLSGATLVITDSSGTTHNVTLGASTTYTSGDGSAASQSGLTAGTSVAAFGSTASDGTVTATRVIINPNLPSGAGGGASGGTQTN